jgi:hypothetical protein
MLTITKQSTTRSLRQNTTAFFRILSKQLSVVTNSSRHCQFFYAAPKCGKSAHHCTLRCRNSDDFAVVNSSCPLILRTSQCRLINHWLRHCVSNSLSCFNIKLFHNCFHRGLTATDNKTHVFYEGRPLRVQRTQARWIDRFRQYRVVQYFWMWKRMSSLMIDTRLL